MLISYCVVNTNGRELLMRCLDAIERTHPPNVEREILVLDNASDDGSADAVRARGGDIRLIALDRRTGKAENDSTLLREARGDHCVLLNEDAELQPGAPAALHEALAADPGAGAAAAQLLDPSGAPQPCAWHGSRKCCATARTSPMPCTKPGMARPAASTRAATRNSA